MSFGPILSLVTWLPIAGTLFIFLIRDDGEVSNTAARRVALMTTTITFLLSLGIWPGSTPIRPISSSSRNMTG
ncbi:MAG TPA: hypothetical protein PK405_07210, partial [Hyphomicrobiales bacterium]|nr:hypothetical protein [Hyphomicrobiales bacterium]